VEGMGWIGCAKCRGTPSKVWKYIRMKTTQDSENPSHQIERLMLNYTCMNILILIS
jgi:hypothetical protein